MKRTRLLAATGALALTAAAGTATVAAATPTATFTGSGSSADYIVLALEGQNAQAVADRLAKAGAEVTNVNTAIGMISVKSNDKNFVDKADKVAGVEGSAAERVIGSAPTAKPNKVEKEHVLSAIKKSAAPKSGSKGSGDPLDSYLWGMDMIKAPAAHRITKGDKRVRIGVIDTGVDGRHPDLAGNFDKALSRNFTTDIPAIDGPCEYPSCKDPNDVDNGGHGTHVAGTIAAAANGLGVSGVAPGVDLVNVRAGQDSGYFFLGPVANALTYAGDAGLDAVNMSFYVDPWMYNCLGGAPEDSPAEAKQQNTIIKTMRRALTYAHNKNVTLVAALGNNHEDVSKPRVDVSSPDYPADMTHPRTIDNATCFDLPVEGPYVLGVSSLGPSGKKSDFSNYTTDLTGNELEVSAPGGWYRDGYGTDTFMTNENLILSTAPRKVLQETGEVDANGNITELGHETGVMKQCTATKVPGQDRCGFYQWLQGTSMASPHATGVVALAVSAHGTKSADGLTLDPAKVRMLMLRNATNHACPPGGVQEYTNEGRDAEFTAKCDGTKNFNGFYGAGIVNALGVVR